MLWRYDRRNHVAHGSGSPRFHSDIDHVDAPWGSRSSPMPDSRKHDSATPDIQRQVLPIPDVTPVGLTTFDAKDPATRFPPIRQLRPPIGAPNVLVILIDD